GIIPGLEHIAREYRVPGVCERGIDLPMNHDRGALRDDLEAIERVALQIAVGIARRPQSQAAVLAGDVFRHFVELWTGRVAAAHGIVGDDADAATHVVLGNRLSSLLDTTRRLK